MDGGHEALQDGEVVVDHLGQGGETVGGAGGVGDHVQVGRVLVLVHTHHEHRSIRGGSGDDHLLGSSGQMCRGSGHGGEHSSGLHHVLRPGAGPGDGLGVPLAEDGDGLPVDGQFAALGLADGHISAVVAKVSGVVSE